MAYAAGFMSRVLVERGDVGGARQLLGRVRHVAPGSDGDLLHRRGTIEVLLADQRWDEALDAVDEYADCVGRVVNPAWAPLAALSSRACRGAGRTDDAAIAAIDGVDAARRWGAPGTVAAALRTLGSALDVPGSDDCLAIFGEAVELASTSPARLEHAKALVALGSARRRRNRAVHAREPLDEAAELATVCGATPLVEHARAELRAAGGRARRRVPTGVGALTPSELRVATLAAAGRTNRAIAQELYVTPKTVEVHLSAVYRKLGISSRTELESTGVAELSANLGVG